MKKMRSIRRLRLRVRQRTVRRRVGVVRVPALQAIRRGRWVRALKAAQPDGSTADVQRRR
jgi:hypothetical protein